ncbi:MAG: clostripain-related cysteine peptidase [Candidatus Limiplasma sp.]|nr:clostripain-related cysteine peptidase [Candidatus Limiplasma sp.]
MKKLISALLAAMLLWSFVPLSALAAQDTFTLMIYMCGTDLESDGGLATMDLSEMVKSGLPRGGNVTVYVQTGGTKSWHARGLTDRQTERWLVSKDGLQLVQSLGQANMGSQAVLEDFLRFGIQNYPADRYGLVFWDHGAGPALGICHDEITGDSLDMREVYGALESASKTRGYRKFAFVGFDACLMASYEVACHLAPFADYMIASEELEPGTGWNYSDWLPKLSANPGIDIRELGPVIVDGFIRASVAQNPSEYATLSLTDLSKLGPLQKAMEGLAASLQGQILGGNLMGVSRIRQNVRSMGEIFDSASDLLDVTYYAKIYQQFDPANAKAAASALKDAVVYSRHTNNLANISGLTVLVPYSTRASIGRSLPQYDAYGLFPQHTAFVKGMAQSMNAGSYTFSSTSVQQESLSSAQSDWLSSSGGSTGGLLDWLLGGWEDSAPSQSYGQYDDDDFESWFSQGGAPAQGDAGGAASDFSLDSFLSGIFGGDVTSADFDEEAFDPEDGGASGAWEDNSGKPEDEEDREEPLDSDVGPSQDPFSQAQGDYAYVVTLSQEELQYLAKAEATLMMDVSDPDFECYVDLGYVQDVLVDWTGGKIYGLFDGTWPSLDGQMVCMYDQIVNENYTRSLIPVTVNREEQYLLVVFDQSHPEGFVMGYTQGYTEAGMPVRGYTELQSGDVVIPQYELLYWDENNEQQFEPFEGDPITVGSGGAIPFAYAQVEGDADYVYGFCLNDIFGEYQFTDFVTLSY